MTYAKVIVANRTTKNDRRKRLQLVAACVGCACGVFFAVLAEM